MLKQIQEAYIVAATRTPTAKRNGMFRSTRPESLLAHVLSAVVAQVPQIDPALIGDVIVGCAIPEAEQGTNIARVGLLQAGFPSSVPGVTVNRLCSSGLQAVADAAARIQLGEADVMIAAGVESMTIMHQLMGNKVTIDPIVFEKNENLGIAYGMGLTAEKVAEQWKISREAQDAFAVMSNQRAAAAIAAGKFNDEISPYLVRSHMADSNGAVHIVEKLFEQDEGVRADASIEGLAKLKPIFAAKGSVTAGNTSQMSDGAAAVMIVSEKILKEYNLTPLARFAGFAVAGVPAEIMGIGPIKAIPQLLAKTGVKLEDIGWIELNEAFAAQSLAVIKELDLDPARVNPQGGAIALGHPLGATGAIRTATLVHGMKNTGAKWGMVSMCVGTGMGAAGLFEIL
jgi:acetyl-CoA acyltransferase